MKYFFTLYALAFSIGCSYFESETPENYRTGFIIANISEKKLKENEIPYKVLNSAHSIYEVFTDKEKLGATFGTLNFIQNEIIPLSLNRNLNEHQELSIENCESTSENSEPIIFRALSDDSLSSSSRFQIELGESIELKRDANKLSNKSIWKISAPKYSSISDSTLSTGNQIKILPDALGIYEVTSTSIRKDGACFVSKIQFNVTSNEKYSAQEIPDRLNFDDIQAHQLFEAKVPFKISKKKDKTIIAVIDTGINYNSLHLNNKIALNKLEIPNNDFDDDKNGFKDDYAGYDFQNNDPHSFDDSGHGSHLAGIIAAEGFGAGYNIEILPLKVGNGFGFDKGSVLAAIFYAVDRGAKVINLSLGWTGEDIPTSALELNAFKYAQNNDVLVVTAAGNGTNGFGYDLADEPIFPASYSFPNIITVGAFSESLKPITFYSNFGSHVDIVAPGGDFTKGIDSITLPNPENILFATEFGTSQAAAIVSALAGEIFSHQSKISAAEVKSSILENGDHSDDLEGLVTSSKFINFEKSLDSIERSCGSSKLSQ